MSLMAGSQVVRAADLVAVQAGAVVSRQLVKQEKGNVTAFAFDAGQGLSEHSAPFDALVHGIEGEAVVVIGGTPHVVKAGDVLLMPANVPHGLKATSSFKMILTMIRG